MSDGEMTDTFVALIICRLFLERKTLALGSKCVPERFVMVTRPVFSPALGIVGDDWAGI